MRGDAMKMPFSLALIVFSAMMLHGPSATFAETLRERNEVLFLEIRKVHGLSEAQMDAVRTIFAQSGYMGQGNPAVTEHPMTEGE
jgi:hypothetical protein